MPKDISKLILSKKLFSPNETIVVALSGGVDSMVLLHILKNLDLNLQLVISHVNHNKRKESKAEYKNIKAMANEMNIPFEGYSIEYNEKLNFHDDSRNQRYIFFKAVAQKYKATKIVVAHHLDDQVETTIMRLTRGTSFSGYAGIPAIRKDRNISIIRPLMEVTKDAILNYAKEHKVTYFDDSSNAEDYYTRNRYRHNIIPLLKKENPNLNEKIMQFKDYIESADIVLIRLKDDFIKKHCFYNNVNLEAFNKLDKIIKIKVLQHLVNLISNNQIEVSYENYTKMISMCLSKVANRSLSLGNNYNFVKEYEYFFIEKEAPYEKIDIKVTKLGEYFISDNDSIIISANKIEHIDTNYFELCYNNMVFPLFIRNRKNGDKMLLKVGTKKVKDILIDQKIPLSKRDKLILITDKENVLWIPNIKKSLQDKNCKKRIYIYEVK